MLAINKDERDYVGKVMINFDHSIDKEVAKQLKNPMTYAEYLGWNFHGIVWYENESYHCMVKMHGSHVDTISSENLSEIMNEASFKYGYD